MLDIFKFAIKFTIGFMITLILTINVLGLVYGSAGLPEKDRPCTPPYTRLVKYVIPAYKLGCWLGEKE